MNPLILDELRRKPAGGGGGSNIVIQDDFIPGINGAAVANSLDVHPDGLAWVTQSAGYIKYSGTDTGDIYCYASNKLLGVEGATPLPSHCVASVGYYSPNTSAGQFGIMIHSTDVTRLNYLWRAMVYFNAGEVYILNGFTIVAVASLPSRPAALESVLSIEFIEGVGVYVSDSIMGPLVQYENIYVNSKGTLAGLHLVSGGNIARSSVQPFKVEDLT